MSRVWMERIIDHGNRATLLMRSLVRAVLFLAGLSLVGCQSEPREPLPFSHHFELGLGDRVIRVQLALSSAEIRNGLMFRDQLAGDEGMLFVFDQPRELGFWMRNTKIPLDVAYFTADGVLREVYPLYPYDENVVRSRSNQLQLALEMNQGWFARHEVAPGARLNLGQLAEAIQDRGHDPVDYLP